MCRRIRSGRMERIISAVGVRRGSGEAAVQTRLTLAGLRRRHRSRSLLRNTISRARNLRWLDFIGIFYKCTNIKFIWVKDLINYVKKINVFCICFYLSKFKTLY